MAEPTKQKHGVDFLNFVLDDDPKHGTVRAVLWLTNHPKNAGQPGEISWVQPINPSVDLVERALTYFNANLPEDRKQFLGTTRHIVNPNVTRAFNEVYYKNDKSSVHAPNMQAWNFEQAIRSVINSDPEKYKDLIGISFEEICATHIDKLSDIWKEYLKRVQTGTAFLSDGMKKMMIDLLSIYEGNGPQRNHLQTFMSCIDRYNQNIMVANIEQTGLTFITRPRLCFQSSNLRSQRRMSILDVDNPNTIAFAIRALLDTNLTGGPGTSGSGRLSNALLQCPLINPLNPFMTPLMNALTALSGLPDKFIESEKTYGGYQMEAQTFAIGGDDLSQSGYQLQLEFKELQGGIISSIFYFWEEYIRCVTRGLMLAYPDDIDEQCLNYTVSIYRFNLDPTGHYIQDWCKCTGCYPTTLPLGAKLQVNEGEHINPYANKVNVTFECNKVEYRDYAIFMDFNTLMRRYCPQINLTKGNTEYQPGEGVNPADRMKPDNALQSPTLPRVPWSNFIGLPWITSDVNGPKLEFRMVDAGNPIYSTSGDAYFKILTDKLMSAEIARMLANSGKARDDQTRGLSQMYPEMLKKGMDYMDSSKVTVNGADYYGCSNLVSFARTGILEAAAEASALAEKK